VVVASKSGREHVCSGCQAAILADRKARGWKPGERAGRNRQGASLRNLERVARMCKAFGCRNPFAQPEEQ
jgi:hypothetical protein